MKILLTGGCGFIGSNLVPYLLNEGHAVKIVDNLSRGSLENLAGCKDVTFLNADIRDCSLMRAAVQGSDAVVHLAAFGSVAESLSEPDKNFSVNVEGTFSVLNAVKEEGVKRLIFASTGGALFGDTKPPVTETTVPKPISPYGASKLAGEGYCSAYAHSYGITITALRFANVVGPKSLHKKGVLTNFFRAILENRPLTIYGDGSATRDFIFVGDLCDGICKAIWDRKPGLSTYHLATGREVSIRELAELTLRITGKRDYPIIYLETRQGEVSRNFASPTLAVEDLNFRVSYTLEDALRRTWEWYRDNYAETTDT